MRIIIKGLDLVGNEVTHLSIFHESLELAKVRAEVDFTAMNEQTCRDVIDPLTGLVNSIHTNPDLYQIEEMPDSRKNVYALEQFLSEVLMTAWNHNDAKIYVQS